MRKILNLLQDRSVTLGGIPIIITTDLQILFLVVAFCGVGQGIFDICEAFLFVTMCWMMVLAHEFGHIFVAKCLGYEAETVHLSCIGGVASIPGNWQDRPLQELLITAGGPAVNAVLAFLLYWASGFKFQNDEYQSASLFMKMNLGMALFNLIPIYPMDGGRFLRATLNLFSDTRFANACAAAVGIVTCLTVMILSIYLGQYRIAIIVPLMALAGFCELCLKKQQNC